MDSENEPESLTRLRESKDFRAVEALIEHLRRRDPVPVPAKELALAIDRPKRQIYGLIKIARRYLALTSGEIIPNVRRTGYWIDNRPRPALFESIKSGDRANGHLAAELEWFGRVDQSDLKTTEDIELYIAQQGRIRLAEARLKMSADMRAVMERRDKNLRLAAAARADSKVPWSDLGLDDPEDNN
jgi:hypothetical protein